MAIRKPFLGQKFIQKTSSNGIYSVRVKLFGNKDKIDSHSNLVKNRFDF